MPDTTITLGNIITIVSTLGAVTAASVVVFMRLGKLEHRLNLIWNKFRKDHDIDDSE